MRIPQNIIANADDLGSSIPINRAILRCFEAGYINSTSILTNTNHFDETVDLIHKQGAIKNVGVHVNLIEGLPVSNFKQFEYLDENGNWNAKKVNRKLTVLNKADKAAFMQEIYMQIDKALSAKILISHLDSHYHLHTLPCFFNLFLQASKYFKLKLRLAQTFNEGNYVNFEYRRYINYVYKKNKINYSDYFVTVDELLKNKKLTNPDKVTEVMLHPDFDSSGSLTDHFDKTTIVNWLKFLEIK